MASRMKIEECCFRCRYWEAKDMYMIAGNCCHKPQSHITPGQYFCSDFTKWQHPEQQVWADRREEWHSMRSEFRGNGKVEWEDKPYEI